MEDFTKILTKRTDCMIYYAGPEPFTQNCTSWIGGNAPDFFDDKADLIHSGGKTYYFYLSLVNPFNSGSMISIFIPADYEDYLENNIYPHCSVKVIEHPVSAESAKPVFTHPGLVKHAIVNGEESNDEKAMGQPFLIKLGGNPRLIQNEDYYFTNLIEDAFSFLFQVDEDGYPETLLQCDCSYPFGFGALYIFAKMGTDEIRYPVAGFWQFS